MEVLTEIVKSIIYGLVQGLGKFLPISSSGHLLLTQRIFGDTEGSHLSTVLLHVATLIAVLVVYRSQIMDILKKPLQKKTLWLVVSTAVTVVVMLVLKKILHITEDVEFRLLGYSFLATALILTAAEYARHNIKRRYTGETMKWHHSVIIGAMQGIAILPGVSRSGSTITGAFFCGVKKKSAAEFSFLLSIPAIVGGAILEIPDLIENGLGDFSWYGTLVAMIFAGVSGYFAVSYMIRLITKKSFRGFIIYTALLGIFVLLNQYVLHIF